MNAAMGTRIRTAREGASLTQAQLGARLGLAPDMISKIEHGTRRVSGEELAVISRATGVRYESLLYDPVATSYRGREKGDPEQITRGEEIFRRFISNWSKARALEEFYGDE